MPAAVAHPIANRTTEQTAEGWLRFALDGLAEAVGASLAKLINAQLKRHATTAAVNHAVKEALPQFLEQGLRDELFGGADEARKRRVALLHFLTTVETEALMGLPAGAMPALTGHAGADELTSEQTAKLLGVSRTHVNMLINSKALPASRTAGGHRRVPRAAAVAYKAQMKERQAKGLDQMVEASQRLGLYDNELEGVPRRTKR